MATTTMTMMKQMQLFTKKNRKWVIAAGLITLGTVVKVVAFNYSRQAFRKDEEKLQEEGAARLREAYAYAEWSRKDREARLPAVTEEQQAQITEYKSIILQHGMTELFKGRDCIECPFQNMTSLSKKQSSE